MIIFAEKIEEGIKQSNEGKIISNDDVKSMIKIYSNQVFGLRF